MFKGCTCWHLNVKVQAVSDVMVDKRTVPINARKPCIEFIDYFKYVIVIEASDRNICRSAGAVNKC